MKRLLFIVLTLSIAAAAVAAANKLPSAVRDVVERALANEREAAVRYEAFAVKAVEEGYPGAAALFRAQARAEKTHAARFARILSDNNLPLPAEPSFTQKTGSTEDNLRAAASAEITERDSTYRQAIDLCKQHGASEIAKIFDVTRDTEVEHANLCTSAARNLKTMTSSKTFYVCDRCGYTTDINLSYCPACSRKERLTAVE